jgi:N-acetylmuramic acid 6-phosphate etherase
MSLGEIVGCLLEEDAGVVEAVRAAHRQIERAAAVLVEVLAGGGRWINVGAGTSGRLGVLDAAEIPPTFGLDPSRVQAILAGGPEALERAAEGAEDDAESGDRALCEQGLEARDAVVLLSASGRTPFTLGALARAREVGARTVCITCNPDSPLAESVEVPIVVVVGPEAVAGSTRLKGGLAQKMVLHTLSTAAMVKLGKVRGNLMAELRPVTKKLRARAIAILVQLARIDREDAERALEEASGSVSGALGKLGVRRRGGTP